jgi:hypothetical protein
MEIPARNTLSNIQQFAPATIEMLLRVYDEVWEELSLSQQTPETATSLAASIRTIAAAGQTSEEQIKTYASYMARHLIDSPSSAIGQARGQRVSQSHPLI